MITTLALLAHYTGPRAVWLIVVRSLLTKADNSFDSLMQAGFELLLQYAECPGAFDNRDLLWARLDLETFARPYVFGKIAVTELEPANGAFIGKSINHDGSITQYPTVTLWRQGVARVPCTTATLFEYLREARTRNICLIRGAPANVSRAKTRRQKAYQPDRYGKDRGDHGFTDEPTRLHFLDIDGVAMQWQADPERAVKRIVALLGEPWSATSFVWFFSATHGLARDEHKRWTGELSDDNVRVRLAFITERALNEEEAAALTASAKAIIREIDLAISRRVQPNYIKRPRWKLHPERDVLGNYPTIGWVQGTRDYLAVADDLTHTARWAQAQGQHGEIADHPDAESAVRGIGGDGSVRAHLKSAVRHLLNANPEASAADVVAKLRVMVEQHREEVLGNLAQCGRGWADVQQYLTVNMTDWAEWLLAHPGALARKHIKLTNNERRTDEGMTLEAVCKRVAADIERARKGEARSPFIAYANEVLGMPAVELLAAPPGSTKSTQMRAQGVNYVTERPDKNVVILMPRHRLGDEQVKALMREHPDYADGVARWLGRQQDDPETPDPEHPGKFSEKMCRRPEEAKKLEDVMLSVERNLCKQGRGEKQVVCPLYDVCGFQRQKQVEARIWLAAHECAVHEMPKAFGDVGWVMFDESPLDAFMLHAHFEADAARVRGCVEHGQGAR